MNHDFSASPNRVPWPPIIYLGVALAAVGLQRIWPLHPMPGAWAPWLLMAGAAVAGLGLALDLAAMMAMRRARTNILPHRAADQLVTEGVFGLTRNPIYLGNTLLLFGAGLVLASPWMMGGALVAAWLCDLLAIRREERHLASRFGQAFAGYAERVPRWFRWRR